ncbi:hypothetical protein PINS_up020656 [Pythium insidiosum]|nr:hypothetical protein PINS_up020656 [Pythium insidiosum]
MSDMEARRAAADDRGDGSAGDASAPLPRWVQVEKGMLSRLLFPNPVCLLSTQDETTGARNVMTITWLTPINNQVTHSPPTLARWILRNVVLKEM